MSLQDPVLEFWPNVWQSEDNVVYNDDVHKKVLGSDRKVIDLISRIAAISRGKDICGNNKIDVVVKNVFYEKEKQRRTSRNVNKISEPHPNGKTKEKNNNMRRKLTICKIYRG